MKVKEESEKVGLILNTQKTKIMASSPITSWQIERETMETVTGFIFLDSKISANGECSHEIKRPLLLGRKVITNLDSILKSRDITLPTKACLVKAMAFPVVMFRCESWTIVKAECQRIDAFGLWCWRRLLRVPWTARRSNQSILKEISPAYSLVGLMLKPKLQYFGHLMQRTDSLEKTLMLGKIEGRRRWGRQRMRWLASLTRWTWASSGSWWWTGKPVMLQSMGLQRIRNDWATELNWTVIKDILWLLHGKLEGFWNLCPGNGVQNTNYKSPCHNTLSLPWWLSGKESACQCRRQGFNPWSGKMPRASAQLSRVPQPLELSSRARELQVLTPRA